MKTSLRILAPVMAAILLSAGQAHASGSMTVTYVAHPALCCTARNVSQTGERYSVGGFRFTPNSNLSITVDVDDDANTDIAVTACQENPGTNGELPGTCGDGDDASATWCTTGAPKRLGSAFTKNHEVTVFILTQDLNDPGGCSGVATTGKAKAVWT